MGHFSVETCAPPGSTLSANQQTTILASHIDFGTNLPTNPVLTGPGIVDSSNIDATLNGVAKGAR